MKRDVLSALMVSIGVLLCGTVPGIVIGAPMAALGAYCLAEPRVGSQTDMLRQLGEQTR
ncbi:hypothetical protein ACFFQF_08515 [Haladaptatus pallidirubidus]|uniref:Uncharacterized protein n=1 Tax=Haladaptatus pallidirubidus TaxID=1008152 RepID=A0AAV3UGH2_9EURY|nr:hypothetical protein [Haladaptatus pallidirubidus]